MAEKQNTAEAWRAAGDAARQTNATLDIVEFQFVVLDKMNHQDTKNTKPT